MLQLIPFGLIDDTFTEGRVYQYLGLVKPIRVKPAPTNQIVPKEPENPIPHLGLTKLLSIKLGIAAALS
jgi:hypothetical protein